MRKLLSTVLAALVGIGTGGVGHAAIRIIHERPAPLVTLFGRPVSLEQPGALGARCRWPRPGQDRRKRLAVAVKSQVAHQVTRGESDGRIWVEYRRRGTAADTPPGWRFEIGDREIRLDLAVVGGRAAPPLVFNFDPERCHVTLLGLMNEDGSVRLPAVLHFPNQGSLRITATARRAGRWATTPVAASRTKPTSSRSRFPPPPSPAAAGVSVGSDGHLSLAGQASNRTRDFDGFHRNWLNIIQLNPRLRLLANNSTSDTAALCYYEYADIARHTPPLAEGLTALDLVRQTLDRVLGGNAGLRHAGLHRRRRRDHADYPASRRSTPIRRC